MNITVVALGKIGLPLAVQFAIKGHTVVGADINPVVVDQVNAGTEPFPGEAGLGDRLASVVSEGRLTATTDIATAVAGSDSVVIVVPLFVYADGAPDFASIDAATKAVTAGLKPGTLVVYETTLPIGTTRDRFGPMLEAGSGLHLGKDLFLAFSPERVLTGRVFADLCRYPKLIGGVNEASAERVRAFYREVLDFDERLDLDRRNGVWDLGSAEAAEMAKLAETTYRDVNIGLANQFAKFAAAHDIDVFGVIEAANSQPYSHIHRPGIAVGGHCIPIYPRMYLWSDPDATVVRTARDTNAGMPGYAVGLLQEAYGDLTGARVAVLGAAYRGAVKETAFSGVFATVAALIEQHAVPFVHDPLYPDEELEALGFTPYHFRNEVDAVIVQTDHWEYQGIEPDDFPGVRILVDGRRITNGSLWPAAMRHVLGVPAPRLEPKPEIEEPEELEAVPAE